MAQLPKALAKPYRDDAGNDVGQVVFDLTAYLPVTTVKQLGDLVDWYRRVCPPDRLTHYAIAELDDWDLIDDPDLTKQGRAASGKWAILAPVCKRLLARRPFHLLFWDGQDIDTYCFSLRQIRDEQRQLHAFVRMTVPTSVDTALLLEAARELADGQDFYSGHLGFCFGYDPERKIDAFTAIYPLARRFWGIDVEDLNGTLTLMKDAIKGVNWITLIGSAFAQTPAVAQAALLPQQNPLVQLEKRKKGLLFRVGDGPSVGDRHRPDAQLNALTQLGAALAPLIVRGHPHFCGDGFIKNDNTDGWFHRFDNPSGWS